MPASPPRLDGKVALVTGSSRGIGRSIAQRLASAGATVVVTARSKSAARKEPGTLDETVSLVEQVGGRAIAIPADVENAGERDGLIARTVEAAGRLDILINNAGYAEYVRVEDMTLDVFDRTVDHYLRVPFLLSKAAIPIMRQQGGGWIVNVGSVEAQPPLKPYMDHSRQGGATIYSAIKAALNRFTQGLAAELEADNIAVNMIAPSSAIMTPGAARFIPEGFPTEQVEYLAETTLALCHLPAAERTGLLTHSMHFPTVHGLAVYGLDGRTPMPPAEYPQWSHPAINPTGE